MSKYEEDGPAFPIVHPDGSGVQYYGVTMRDYFAAKAMQGLLGGDLCWHGQEAHVAERAYLIADAMLEARK